MEHGLCTRKLKENMAMAVALTMVQVMEMAGARVISLAMALDAVVFITCTGTSLITARELAITT